MPIHKFTTREGHEFSFSIHDTKIDRPSFFVFSVPKSGSTLLMQMLMDVCKQKKIPVVDLATEIFNLGIQPTMLTKDINTIWKEQGYAYLGFRSFFPAIDFDFNQTKNILLVRDPRDMLVSLYFSIKYSHVEPADAGSGNSIRINRERLKTVDINQSVLEMAKTYKKYFQDYLTKLPTETTRVYRYEDVIFKKKEWLEDMLAFLNIELPIQTIRKIANKYDIRPGKEDPHKHIRQIVPGNYKSHLKPATVEKLDDLFKPIMEYFLYNSVLSLSMNSEANRKAIQKKVKGDFERDWLQQDLEKMRQSRSWRLTHPLRSLVSFYRKLSGV